VPGLRNNPKVLRAKQAEFLLEFSRTGNLAAAARAAKVTREVHYSWLRDPLYKAAYQVADEEATDRLVEEARRRGADGYEEPIIYAGKRCYEIDEDENYRYETDEAGNQVRIPLTIRRYDSNLLTLLIKGRRPEMYRDNVKIDATNTSQLNVNIDVEHKVILRSLSDEQLNQLESWLLAISPSDGEGDSKGSARGEDVPLEE
jgi:hypothetical protein